MRAAENILQKVGAAILALRKRIGWSQLELARWIEKECQRPKALDPENIGRWERGDVMPSGDFILALLRLCPDAESLHKFGLDIAKLGEQYSLGQLPREEVILLDTSPVVTRSDGRPIIDKPTRKRQSR